MTEKAQHTPGPWFYGSYLKEDGAKCVASIGGAPQEEGEGRNAKPLHCDILTRRYFPPTPDEAFANAHLIAAAPELLEALEVMVRWVAGTCDYLHVAKDLEKSRAAIAKARGQV